MASGIHAIVLAAGRSSRFGRAKLLEELDGKSLVRRALETAQCACPGNTWLVTGHTANAIADAAAGIADHIVYNPDYESGMGTSIASGVTACSQQADAVVVMLADQALITESHLSDLARSWSGDAGRIVATAFSGTLGPPVLFGQDFFDELSTLDGDDGAKQLLRRHAAAVRSIRFEPAMTDIDTRGDLNRLINPE